MKIFAKLTSDGVLSGEGEEDCPKKKKKLV